MLYFDNSTLSLSQGGATAGAWLLKAQPTIDDIDGLRAILDSMTKWTINTTVSTGGWYSIGVVKGVASGQMTIRSDHNLVTVHLGRIYSSITGEKWHEVQYAGSVASFTSLRVKEHPTSIYTDYVVQIYLNPSYITSAKEFSALWNDLCPSAHGTSATALSILPVDFVPDGTAITSPISVDVSSWAVAYTLAI